MSSLVVLAFGYLLLILETGVSTLVPLYGLAPNLMLPIAIFLGVSAEVHILRGALTSFALGYLLDSFSGTGMGLQTLVLTTTFMVARGAGLRLLPQGRAMQVLLCFMMAMTFGATVFALRAIFEQSTEGDDFTHAAGTTFASLLKSSAATALLSPVVFAATARVQAFAGFRREKRTLSH
jgi:rod shape-determining protein MreD